MSRFDYCFKTVLKLEGGYVNDPSDRGGKTNYGVTQATYTGWLERYGRAHKDVKEITLDEVRDIYGEYWRDARCSYFPEPLDLLVFDCAINSGAGRAIKLLQTVLVVTVDGVVGRQTMNAIHEEMAAGNILDICDIYLKERKRYYEEIVRHNPSQRKFLTGWINRLSHLQVEIDRDELRPWGEGKDGEE